MSSRLSLIVAVFALLAVVGATSAQAWRCLSDDSCPDGDFCKKADGYCGGTGTCSPIPQACITLYDPVCGCDGVTYSNSCVAAMHSTSVAHKGPCRNTDLCVGNESCGLGRYCSKPYGDCRGIGVCQDRPTICPTLWDPVCGCDGRTYNDACGAAAMGVSIAYRGVCRNARITDARSHAAQGTNSFGIDLLPASPDASEGIECRSGGPTEVVVMFDELIQSAGAPSPSDVALCVVGGEGGEVVGIMMGGDEIRVELADVPDASRVTLTFPGIVGLEGNPVEGSVSFGVLQGDVNGDGFVNVFDLVAARNAINLPVTPDNYRKDVNADGAINVFDLVTIRNALNKSLPDE